MDVRPALAAALLLVALALAPPAGAVDLKAPASLTKPPAGYELTAREVIRIAERRDEVRSERRDGQLEPHAYTRGPGRWQVSFFRGDDELVQVHVDDRTRAAYETWTGSQVAWRMARGYEGAFGRKFNAPYVWIPLGLLFLAPFIDFRRPFRLLHLDLLVLCSFCASHVFFNRGEIGVSVPLVYPVLVYLLVRMLLAGMRPRGARGPLVPHVPVRWLVLALVFLVGFRIALDVGDSNVIDVGYSGVVGADRIADGEHIYGADAFPEDNAHGDTYGPVNYLLYVPFEQALPWTGLWDDLPAAHGAAIAFDLLTMLGLFVLGTRLRAGIAGRRLGTVLAFAWAAYPYTLFVLATNANDALPAMLGVWALVGVAAARPLATGSLAALAAGAKFGSGALVPLLAGEFRGRRRLAFLAAAAAVTAAVFAPFVPDGGLREIYDRTVGYQAGRGSPFSIWGQAPSLEWLQVALEVAAVAFALALVAVPRRRDARQVAALAASVLIALQLTLEHWFYLYVAWFAPFVFVALFLGHREQPPPPARPRTPEDERVAVPA